MTGPIARAQSEAIQIPRRDRNELPSVPGYYLVHESGRSEPLLLKWTRWSKRFEYPRSVSKVDAVGWAGPIRGVKDEFAEPGR